MVKFLIYLSIFTCYFTSTTPLPINVYYQLQVSFYLMGKAVKETIFPPYTPLKLDYTSIKSAKILFIPYMNFTITKLQFHFLALLCVLDK